MPPQHFAASSVAISRAPSSEMKGFSAILSGLAVVALCAAATKYEAEDALLAGSAKVASCSAASGGQQVKDLGTDGSSSGSVTFTVTVATAGYYQVLVQYMSAVDRSAEIAVNGGAPATHSFTDSGVWCFAGGVTASKTVELLLAAGTNSIKLSNPSAWAPLIDFIDVPATPSTLLTTTTTTRPQVSYEAEAGTLAGTAVAVSCSTASGGQMVNGLKYGPTNSLLLTVSAAAPGIHYMTVKYFSKNERNLIVTVGTIAQTIKMPPSGNWCFEGGVPSQYSINVNLTAGLNSITFEALPAEEAPVIDSILLEKQNPKKGLIVGKDVSLEDASHFGEYISWYYRYAPTEPSEMRAWATQNNIEYVPMIGYDAMPLLDGTKCALLARAVDPANNVTSICSYQDVLDTVESNNMSRTKYIFGSNEPWNPNDANITVAEGVHIWTTYTQPVAQQLGLMLLSPNVGRSTRQLDWIEEFLKLCFDTVGCDVDLMRGVMVHEYKCKESYWISNYDDNGFFFTDLGSRMGSYGGKDWGSWLDAQEIWVTETNCFWETTQPHPSNVQQCQAVTNQRTSSHGMGSLQWMEKSSINRYAWWTTVNKNPSKTQLLVDYTTKELNPTGLAYMNPVSATSC